MINVKIGNIASITSGILLHGCPLQLAKDVSEVLPVVRDILRRWPYVIGDYVGQESPGALLTAGTVRLTPCLPDVTLARAYLNPHGYTEGESADYSDVRECLKAAGTIAVISGLPLHIPRIGSSFDNVPWPVLEALILERIPGVVKTTVWVPDSDDYEEYFEESKQKTPE